MTFSGFSFGFWRVMQIITLIPIVGMLAWFVDIYTEAGSITPREYLILFIVATLAAAWAIGTLFLYARAKHSANFVAFVDLLFTGAFIGAVYMLRGITNQDCTKFEQSNYSVTIWGVSSSGTFTELRTNKACSMLKASFAFGIMNCIFFFLTFLFALLVHRHYDKRDRVVVERKTHSTRHGHRRSHHSSRRSSHYV